MFSRPVALLLNCTIVRLKREGTRAETRFRLSPKRTSPFKSARTSVQSTAGSRGVRISVSNAGYTAFRGSVRVLATHSIRQFPLQFPSCASQCAIRFQTHSTKIVQVTEAAAWCPAVGKRNSLHCTSSCTVIGVLTSPLQVPVSAPTRSLLSCGPNI
jgi:hypothetical protein